MKSFAFVFPGQGSQQLRMLTELHEKYPIIQEVFAKASNKLGFDLWQLTQVGPEEHLNQTENTQPAILTASYAIWSLWCSLSNAKPTLLAGHSLGEYTALVCTGVLSFEEAVILVHKRGLFMQQAVAPEAGAMAAVIGVDNAIIEDCCLRARAKGIVSPANFNSIGQTVIAGDKVAVEYAAELLKEQGARKVIMLAVSVPSHCALMQPAAEQLTELLNKITFQNAQIPIINNVAAKIETDHVAIKNALIQQLTDPVQWVSTIELMQQKNITQVVECGPGKVLTGMNRRITTGMNYYAINTVESINDLLNEENV
jgi:[acyl-carrier-protein] S-malonyltransferase